MSKSRGKEAEDQALTFLKGQGLRLVERNYSTRRGEIDLIMLSDSHLIFVEVKYRRNERFGTAVESVDSKKRERLIAAAQHYLQSNRRFGNHPCRFDVLGFSGNPNKMEWIKDAFGA